MKEIPNTRIDDCYEASLTGSLNDPVNARIIDNKIATVYTSNKSIPSFTGLHAGDIENIIYKRHDSKKLIKMNNPYDDTLYSIIEWQDSKQT